MKQHTIKKPISISGIGLHSGKRSTITFKPAGEGEGISFVRTDLPGRPVVKASLENVSGTDRGTDLGIVSTVEHMLSALFSLSIANIYIEIDGPEPPAFDGSALEFCRILKSAEISEQKGSYGILKVREPVVLIDGDRSMTALPHNGLAVSFMINYPSDFIGSQYYRFDSGEKAFIREIAPARTYGFMNEIEGLRSRGLAAGATKDNAVVIGNEGYVTPLRFPNELVRHKILDLIGDIAMLNSEISAHIVCIRSGHKMNIALAKMLKEVG